MKYKEFKLIIGDNPALSKAVQEHAFDLGYCWAFNERRTRNYKEHYLFFSAFGQIFYRDEFDCKDDDVKDHKKISIRDFFKLTKEDVIVGPERFHCIFSIIHNPTCEAELTQDKIDIIEAIMQEGES